MKQAYNITGIILSALACYAAYNIFFKKNNAMNTGNNNTPRGYRNNNPLNIRINSGNNWLGKVSVNTDGEFEQFVGMEYGYRAAFILIRNYIRKYGANTVAEIISRWAPMTENHTDRYISFVCGKTGFSPNTIINPDNEAEMCALVYAMAWMENGVMPNEAYIRRGWELYS